MQRRMTELCPPLLPHRHGHQRDITFPQPTYTQPSRSHTQRIGAEGLTKNWMKLWKKSLPGRPTQACHLQGHLQPRASTLTTTTTTTTTLITTSTASEDLQHHTRAKTYTTASRHSSDTRDFNQDSGDHNATPAPLPRCILPTTLPRRVRRANIHSLHTHY